MAILCTKLTKDYVKEPARDEGKLKWHYSCENRRCKISSDTKFIICIWLLSGYSAITWWDLLLVGARQTHQSSAPDRRRMANRGKYVHLYNPNVGAAPTGLSILNIPALKSPFPPSFTERSYLVNGAPSPEFIDFPKLGFHCSPAAAPLADRRCCSSWRITKAFTPKSVP